MNITQSNTKLKRLQHGEKQFTITDGIVMVNRASIECSASCPASLIVQLEDAISKGWITPVAYMREEEYVWDSLRD